MTAAELNTAADLARRNHDLMQYRALATEGYNRAMEFRELTDCINKVLFGTEQGVATAANVQANWDSAQKILAAYGAKLHDPFNRLGCSQHKIIEPS